MSNNAQSGLLMKIKAKLICLISILAVEVILGRGFYLYLDQWITKRQAVQQTDSGGESGGHGKAAEPSPVKQVALTFDDGPHPVYTPRLLDGLRERGVHATFFLIGNSIEGNEDIVRRMKEDGHLIGNHSNSHVQLTVESAKAACDEINATNRKILEITGEEPQYIRPPFGSWSEELECMVPMTVVLWDIDPLDWKVLNTRKVVRHILKNVDDNDIILLHDVYGTSVDAALEVVDTLSKEGYTFVTVDELLID